MSYEEKKRRLAEEMKAMSGRVRLGKNTTNLFRDTDDSPQQLRVHDFNETIHVNPQEGWAEVEGMTTYEKFVDACLPHGVMPAVVPELKSITVGGAISGTGLESSSFRFGFVHETMLELDVLLPDGSVTRCTPDNEHSELFFALPNSYGTLGYVLRARVKVVPVSPYVHVTHTRFSDQRAFFDALKQAATRDDIDFLEGVVYGENEHVMSVGQFTEHAPCTSDYTYMHIYYKAVRERDADYLTVRDYIWRWDTDWFWCSRLLFAQNPLVRRLLGRKRLNSIFYMKVIRWWEPISGRLEFLRQLFGMRTESVIQDVEVPIENAPAFLDFFHEKIGMRPIIVGPVIGSPRAQTRFPFFPLDPGTLYVNIGFWGPVKTAHEPGYYNRLIEKKARELDAMKMLYSSSFYSGEEFWNIYGDKAHYQQLKKKYDPENKLGTLYEKCVKGE